ncbi:hypothetical protein Vi05172_g9279 [Venturia inaequalis]|nr:hypothetical protein Vi05172_g9279 [Venturia inaequalis]
MDSSLAATEMAEGQASTENGAQDVRRLPSSEDMEFVGPCDSRSCSEIPIKYCICFPERAKYAELKEAPDLTISCNCKRLRKQILEASREGD